jgi:hypothetical protein
MTDIPITANERKAQFTGNTGLGPFAFTFNILTNSDIRVIKNSTVLTLTSEYTVTTNVDGTGSVTLTGTGNGTALISSDILTIIGNRQLARTSDYVQGGNLFAGALNEDLDSIVIMMQQLDEKVSRTMRIDAGDIAENLLLPDQADRKGKYLAFNAITGNPESGPTETDVVALAAVTSDIALLADIQDGTTATNAITTVSGISSNVTTVANISSSVTTVAGISADVTAVSAIDSDVPIVSGISANVTTVAGISADVTAVAGDATDIGTVAGISADVTTVAGISADVTAVAADATDIGTVATNIADINTAATNIAAIIAAPSEASAAAASAVSAANSAAAAAASFDSFDDRYLGVKASDPTLDNDGNALVAGALYFSSSENIMKVYDGASWIAATSAGNVSLLQYEYTATLGQTTFSGADDNSATLSYTVANLIVTLNGVVLDNGGDYTATNGTSVVLTSGAAAGDLLQVIAFKSFTVADMVPASTGGTFSGNVAVNGNLTVDTNTLFVDAASNNVGIGTTSVSGVLSVDGSMYAGPGSVSGVAYGFYPSATYGNTGMFSPGANTVAFATSGGERCRIDASGNLMVGTTGSNHKLYVVDTTDRAQTFAQFAVAGAGYSFFTYLDGAACYLGQNSDARAFRIYSGSNPAVGVNLAAGGTSWGTYSDERVKTALKPIEDALDKVSSLRAVTGRYLTDDETVSRSFLIAQDVQAVLPEAVDVGTDENETLLLKYTEVMPLLVAAIKDQQAIIEALEARISALEGEPA